MSIEKQVVVIYAGTKGYLDKIDVSRIGDYEEGLLKEVDSSILDAIRTEGSISDALDKKIAAFFEDYTARFLAA